MDDAAQKSQSVNVSADFVANLTEPPSGSTDSILLHLAEGTSTATGDAFMKALVKSLAAALGVKWAFVTEFASVPGRVRMLAYWMRGEFARCVEYDLKGTPCEAVLRGETVHYERGAHQLFPNDAWIVRDQIESFLAVPMVLANGEVIGHLAAADDRPISRLGRDLSIFRIFGARAAAEFQRQQTLKELVANEQRLTTILATTLDAVLTIDAQRRIVMFNAAAERIWQCSADWAAGQPVDRFIIQRDRRLFLGCLARACTDDAGSIWLPEGLHAQRADGAAFPIEATLSPLTLGEQRLVTIILRDVSERSFEQSALAALQSENRQLVEVLTRADESTCIVGSHPSIRTLLTAVDQVARADTTVLIFGETGVGKEGIARAVHAASPRRSRPLITVNCATMPVELIESELFGHERGAFTGATTMRKGRFELADGGTLFLDEVGELSLSAQARLLRVLQERTFERVGGMCSIDVDVRVIAATNRNLVEQVAAGHFRRDLYYRLSVFPLEVPPLRTRKDDIPALVGHFLSQFSRKLMKPLKGVTPSSMARLIRHDWPGNIRELRNVLERAAVLGSGPVLEISHAMIELAGCSDAIKVHSPVLDDVLREHVIRTLENCNGIIEGARGAAAVLGVKPSTLRHRMKMLEIKKLTTAIVRPAPAQPEMESK